MADKAAVENNSPKAEAQVSAPAKPKTRAPRKKSEPKATAATPKAVKAAKSPAAVSQVSASATSGSADRKIKRYSPAERASLLAAVEKSMKDGKTTLKAALQKSDLSEQTYYNWKNAVKKTAPKAKVATSDDLKMLVELEAENVRLRKELADKLRAENAELRKRLGKA